VVEKNCSGLTGESLIENEIQKAIAKATETIFSGRNVG